MVIMSPPMLSPASFLTNGGENVPPLGQQLRVGQLPLQQAVSSASPMPRPPSPMKPSPGLSHLASHQYVEQHRTFVEHQRQLHNEERDLWHIERQELHGRITELEAIVRSLRASGSSNMTSHIESPHFNPVTFGGSSLIGTSRITSTTSAASAASTGDEFWRGAGGKSDAMPTRTFSESSAVPANTSSVPNIPRRTASESSDTSNKGDFLRLPSIAEDGEKKKKNVDFASEPSQEDGFNRSTLENMPSIDGAAIDKNLDGISFKPGGLPLSVIKSVITPQTPSPLPSPSPNRISPGHGHLNIPSNRLSSPDPYTRDAGHTPLARPGHGLDGILSPDSATSSQETPRFGEVEKPPLEPRPTVAPSRPPTERAESYFPPVPPPDTVADPDPALTGPLNLVNDSKEDSKFLNELDQKLLQAARTSPQETPSAADNDDADKENKSEGDEDAPKLKIKRSTNFGSLFGEKTLGRLS